MLRDITSMSCAATKITFTLILITALRCISIFHTAEGYASSVSRAFVYLRKLPVVSGLHLDTESDLLVWDALDDASDYTVSVNGGAPVSTGGRNSFSLKEYSGEISVAVRAYTPGFVPSDEATFVFEKNQLATPSGIVVSADRISWNVVADATSYIVKIDGKNFETDENCLPFSDTDIAWSKGGYYSLKIKAAGESESKWSDETVFGWQTQATNLRYFRNVISWDYVAGVSSYEVRINGGSAFGVAGGVNFAEIKLTKAGENLIEVRCADENTEDESEPVWTSLKVWAHTLSLDAMGGEAVAPLYLAVGDKAELAETSKTGYDFGGWYNKEGGAAANVCRMAFGDKLGFRFADGLTAETLFAPECASIVAELADGVSLDGFQFTELGVTADDGQFAIDGETLPVDTLIDAWTGTLEPVFPTKAEEPSMQAEIPLYTERSGRAPAIKMAKPRVVIPVFPGTNCEYDMQKAFENAGAECDVFVVKNVSASDVEFSVAEMGKRLSAAQILAFPGGFSGGDEPDGSGKFIVNMFRNPSLRDAAEELLEKRDGLAIGICNGFQALIKLGLLPFGKIKALEENAPTLTFNNIGRHVSAISRVRVASNASAWLNRVKTGDVFSVPVSHGEGRFVCDPATLQRLRENGQIFTQYVDLDGKPTMQSPFNPNGSVNAVEGIISPDGRVLGKMGHAERIGKGLYRNVAGNWDMGLFRSGVEYFK